LDSVPIWPGQARLQAHKRHFSSTSDYIQHLIRNDVELAEQKRELSVFLQAGLDFGDADPLSLAELSTWMQDVINNPDVFSFSTRGTG